MQTIINLKFKLMLLQVSLSKFYWMDISQLLDQISVMVLRDSNISPETESYYSRIYNASHTIRLEVLKNFPSYDNFRMELKDIDFEKLSKDINE